MRLMCPRSRFSTMKTRRCQRTTHPTCEQSQKQEKAILWAPLWGALFRNRISAVSSRVSSAKKRTKRSRSNLFRSLFQLKFLTRLTTTNSRHAICNSQSSQPCLKASKRSAPKETNSQLCRHFLPLFKCCPSIPTCWRTCPRLYSLRRSSCGFLAANLT